MDINLDEAILNWLKEYATQGILITDTQLRICTWNRWLEMHSEREASQVLGRNLFEVFPELIERRLDRFYRSALAGEVAVLAQRFHRYLLPMSPTISYPDLALMQQSARIAPLLWEGQVAGTITVIEDVTERFAQEQALRQARDELEQRVQERTTALASATERLQSLSRRLLEVQEDERRAIARELHDEAGQLLTSLLLGLGAIERAPNCPAPVIERVAELKRTTDLVMESLHSLAVNLRPASLDRVGLVPALYQYLDSFRRQTGLDVGMTVVGLDEQRLAPDVETTLYRVIQEALTNVARHARATSAGVILEQRGPVTVAIIEDNGVGFNAEQIGPSRLGLLGMRERLEMLGGNLTVESAPGAGTTVFAMVPTLNPHS